MKIKQISVAIENSPGRLHAITTALGEAGVNIRALNLVDVGDFGTVRMLVSDVAEARRVLMEAHIPARIDELVVAELGDEPGSLAKFLGFFLDAGINLMYMYAVIGSMSGKAIMLFRFSDNDKALKVMQQNGVTSLTAEDLGIKQ